MAQPVQFTVHIGVFFNIGIGGGNIGLRLVVIVVGDEKLHGVVGEKLPELRAKLGGQGFVVGQNQGGPLHFLDDVGHGESFA